MPDFGDEKVSIEGVKGINQTDKAVLCLVPDKGEVWIPQSQIDDDSEVYSADSEGTLVISLWIAEQKNLV